ncbi:hypothetical protein A1O3_04437 [Capronia epimyces CBS 606.96]|uniref:Muconate cycloisomerase 1 n=1 Tax=Capronia epimyces CBS 606.96 TaxID=1182542 RepID=W9Y3U6_9EURO|nr:uncharacterized protein A1O3_04437 [Capronia epimyces CBS 606.96]EXJ87477.1 hypothetical protein A1O3_04437 [Capronia epimyces CBS 606.96]
MSQSYDFLVGTFNTPQLYTLRFTPPTPESSTKSSSSGSGSNSGNLRILHRTAAIGSHSWLHLSPPKTNGTRNLYATAWTEPPSVVAYAVDSSTKIKLLSRAQTKARSGYVTANDVAVYSAGGATGEVFSIDRDSGTFVAPQTKSASEASPPRLTNGTTAGSHHTAGQSSSQPSSPNQLLQTLSFVDSSAQRDNGSVMDFGGLRHGAHSADLSPSGNTLYIADIGRNCIWTFAVSPTDGSVTLGEKHISPRPNDGPRHVWPHPAGGYVYCVQEHTSMVDVFSTNHDGVSLTHKQGVRIIPPDQHEQDFWADEVRTSLSRADRPQYLYASTRGLKPGKKGYVAVYKLTDDGRIDTSVSGPKSEPADLYAGLLYMYETPNSGGWANAIQPGPTVQGVEYLALTDSEDGWVFVLSWNGAEIKEVARTKLDPGAGAATAVWL